MSTGYYTSISNTVVSGNQLLSSLSGADVRNLEFAAACSNSAPLLIPNASSVSISANHLIQAAVDRQLLDATLVLTAGSSILLGPDAASQAAAYVRLFNLTSTNQVRLLKFVNSSNLALTAQPIALANSSGTAASVQISSAGGAASSTGLLLAAGATVGQEANVLLQGVNLASGSEAVIFRLA